MTELYICTANYSDICPDIADLRRAFLRVTLAAWKHLGLEPRIIEAKGKPGQRQRRIWVDQQAQSDSYIIAPDDVIPEFPFDVAKGFAALKSHPEFAHLGASITNETINKWTPEDYDAYEDGEVSEHVSVGSIGFARKGVVKEWPPMSPDCAGYDTIHAEHLRSLGYRLGYLKHLKCVHLGKNCSSVWRNR